MGNRDDDMQAPQLLPPQPLLIPAAATGATMAVAALGLGLWWYASGIDGDPGKAAPPGVVSIPADRVPGAVMTLLVSGNDDPTFVLAKMAVDPEERTRLRADLAQGRIRIGMIRLWDTVHEDGDRVRLDGAGYTQELTILHKPGIFYLPFVPGGSARITAIRDGGGGVTLGVATVLGPVHLPPLKVGQAVEIPIL